MALTTNLVSYWKLDESSGNAADSVGSNTLTNNGTTTYTAARIANGASMNGSTQFLSIADGSQSGLDITGAMSMAGWFKLSANPSSSNTPLMSKYAQTTNRSYMMYVASFGSPDYRLAFIGFNGAGTIIDLSQSITFATGVWYHWACTFGATGTNDFKFYVNGAQVGTTKSSGVTDIRNGGAAFQIGAATGEPAYSMLNGIADECGIWSRELSSTEISQLYNSGVGLTYPFTSSGTTIFSDNFDALSTGNINGQGGWSATANGNYTVSTAQAFSTPNSLAGLNNDNGQNPVSHTFTATGGTITLTGYIRTDTASIVGGYCGIMDGSGNGWFVRFNSAGNFFLTDSTTFTNATTFGSYTNNTWYKLEMEVDSTNKQARSRVNGGTWSSYVSNASYGGTASLVKLVNGGSYTGTSYWDNISVVQQVSQSAVNYFVRQAVKRASYY